jgi:protein-tyrosine phosphatase
VTQPARYEDEERMTFGRIDIHSHLLPCLDDGCAGVAESVECARRMVAAGYTHSFCTPHVWTSNPHNNATDIPLRVADLQKEFDEAGVPLKLIPGGENNFTELQKLWDKPIVTYGMAGRYVLSDIWVDSLPQYFFDAVHTLQDRGLTVILAHPERMRAVQDDPKLADTFDELGILMQGNLQCFADRAGSATRSTAEMFLREDRYAFLGSDLHTGLSLDVRLNGLKNAIDLAGDAVIDRLTIVNPQRLLEGIEL